MPLRIQAHACKLSEDDRADLEAALERYNSVQQEFVVEVPVDSSFLDDADVVDAIALFDRMKHAGIDSRAVVFTSLRFSDDYFSHTCEGRKTAVSTDGWRERHSPPGVQCFLLMELALVTYYAICGTSETESGWHEEAVGCLLDFCEEKDLVRWKLRVGYLCAEHSNACLQHGATVAQLDALARVLDEVRRLGLGIPSVGPGAGETGWTPPKGPQAPTDAAPAEFTLEWLKRHPIVVASIIAATTAAATWGVLEKVRVKPLEDKVAGTSSSNNAAAHGDICLDLVVEEFYGASVVDEGEEAERFRVRLSDGSSTFIFPQREDRWVTEDTVESSVSLPCAPVGTSRSFTVAVETEAGVQQLQPLLKAYEGSPTALAQERFFDLRVVDAGMVYSVRRRPGST